ncbi:MAG: DUF4286 family protein [Gammaproteobacteria bacterium]|nr:DUF4286 family protein [Gammaproteobacteria bacterium]
MSAIPKAVIYEVRLEVDSQIVEEYDAWLAGHIDEMLAFDGFLSAEVLRTSDRAPAGEGRSVRVVQYRVASRGDLDRYFEKHAARMREQGIDRFGQQFNASREIYETSAPQPSLLREGRGQDRICQNCKRMLEGQYCAQCGQRDKNQIISLWELLRDLVGDVFEVDSRIWRTLRPLLFRPGQLTNEYLRGRRVHYTPPLRLYLITSLIFFLVVFFNSTTNLDGDLTINGDEDEATQSEDAGSAETPEASPDATDPEPADRDQCLNIEIGDTGWANAIEERAQRTCRRLTAEGGGRQFLNSLVDNVPGMMFFFLPAIALVMVLLYPLSRRYYVEHLLFFVHFHSFFFVLLTITVLFSRLPEALPGQGVAGGILTAATTIYVPIYLFVAMRRVYGQSRSLTALKYITLGIAYFVSLLFTFVIVVLFTALSV